MKLLIDTDIFCKLGMANLLAETVELFGLGLDDCGRLPALPHMLRHGRLRRNYGDHVCDQLIPLADAMEPTPAASSEWLDKLVSVESIDPGEAQLLAVAAEQGVMLLSGDKRALRALSKITDIHAPLERKICVLEAALLALVGRHGADEIRRRVPGLSEKDRVVRVCFPPTASDPRDGLFSYLKDIANEVTPLVLWTPEGEATA